MKYNFLLNENGYIDGYSKDLFDSGGVELTDEQVASIVLGSTKYTDGQLVVDTEHQKAIEAEQAKELEADQPIDYEAKIAELEAKLQEATNATLELADMMLGGDTNDASVS